MGKYHVEHLYTNIDIGLGQFTKGENTPIALFTSGASTTYVQTGSGTKDTQVQTCFWVGQE